jgi:hypothetical protein
MVHATQFLLVALRWPWTPFIRARAGFVCARIPLVMGRLRMIFLAVPRAGRGWWKLGVVDRGVGEMKD